MLAGEWAFSVAAPWLWNNLPEAIRQTDLAHALRLTFTPWLLIVFSLFYFLHTAYTLCHLFGRFFSLLFIMCKL